MTRTSKEREGINPKAKPTGTGCVECLETDGWWLHLRRCTQCGHIGCCDNSPSQHATKHNATTHHPIITSFEYGEDWFYDYRTGEFFVGPELVGPHSHPPDQPAPGPLVRFPKTGSHVSTKNIISNNSSLSASPKSVKVSRQKTSK